MKRVKTEEDNDIMKDIDEYEPNHFENVEKALCNLNIHIALISSQMVELTKASATFNKQLEMLWDELRGVRIEAVEIKGGSRKGV